VIASGGSDGLIVLSHATGTLLGTLKDLNEKALYLIILRVAYFIQATEVLCLCFSSGSRYLCTGASEHLIKIWDLKKKEAVKALKVGNVC
jgi:WD40 repeat protein